MRSSATCRGPAAPRRTRDSKRTPTVPWTSTSHPSRRRARSRTGFPPAPIESSKSSSASTAPRSRCSTRRGFCRTSRRRAERAGPAGYRQRSNVMKPIGMKTLRTLTAAALGFTAWATAYAAQAQTPDPHGWVGTEKVETRYGNFEFKNGYPTAEAADKLYELRTFNRAVEAYLSQLPAISMFYMRK